MIFTIDYDDMFYHWLSKSFKFVLVKNVVGFHEMLFNVFILKK